MYAMLQNLSEQSLCFLPWKSKLNKEWIILFHINRFYSNDTKNWEYNSNIEDMQNEKKELAIKSITALDYVLTYDQYYRKK